MVPRFVFGKLPRLDEERDLISPIKFVSVKILRNLSEEVLECCSFFPTKNKARPSRIRSSGMVQNSSIEVFECMITTTSGDETKPFSVGREDDWLNQPVVFDRLGKVLDTALCRAATIAEDDGGEGNRLGDHNG
jgi:hypothetical protein